jgi:hypothetical protein
MILIKNLYKLNKKQYLKVGISEYYLYLCIVQIEEQDLLHGTKTL